MLEVTNNETASLWMWDPLFDDDTLEAAGAVTWAEGTVLGRITTSGNLTAYTSGAADGSEIPIAVLPSETVFAGAGTAPARVLISGRVRRAKLVAHGVGALTQAEVDALRDFTIVGLATSQLSELDNQ